MIKYVIRNRNTEEVVDFAESYKLAEKIIADLDEIDKENRFDIVHIDFSKADRHGIVLGKEYFLEGGFYVTPLEGDGTYFCNQYEIGEEGKIINICNVYLTASDIKTNIIK